MADYYKVLGVEKGATADAIKKSYRKLALQFHPDRNKGDKAAESKFKEISEAYAVLSDDEKKRQYDAVGDSRFHQQYSQEDIFRGADFGSIFQDFDMGGMENIFGRIFAGAGAGGGGFGQGDAGFGGFSPGGRGGRRHGGGHGGGAQKGQDVEYPLTIGFDDAFNGGERQVSFRLSDGTSRSLKVKIPKGAKDGGKLRVAGMGAPSPHGGHAGDLMVVLTVAAHPRFSRDGDDITCNLPLKISEALLGATRDVETMDGIKKVKIPAGVKPGTKVRLKDLGFPKAGKEAKDQRGDFFVTLEIDVPKNLTPAQREVAEKLQEVEL